MWTVYVIKSKEGLVYTGLAKNVKKRVSDHNSGSSLWTRRGKNWKLVYSKEYKTVKEAREREKYLKNTAG